jgi:hypothetical protein
MTGSPQLDPVAAERLSHASQQVVGVRFTVHNYVWGLHTLEFYADGTAIRRIGDAATVKPTFTLPLS